jgi:hypothetical protein
MRRCCAWLVLIAPDDAIRPGLPDWLDGGVRAIHSRCRFRECAIEGTYRTRHSVHRFRCYRVTQSQLIMIRRSNKAILNAGYAFCSHLLR